jgi:hypothetical protein
LALPSSRRVQAAPSTPTNIEERAAVVRQLDRVLVSAVFRNSRRYPALLRFIVEQTLEGCGESINERILGMEVFKRAADYDTNADHIARTAVGEVRKRLAQYYLEVGAEDEVRIEIPPGAYSAQFRVRSDPAGNPAPTAAPEDPVITKRFGGGNWWRARLGLAISVAANIILTGILLRGGLGTSESALQKFWEPVFGSAKPVLICVGLRDRSAPPSSQNLQDRVVAELPAPPQDQLMRTLAMADVLALSRVTRLAGQRHAQFRILEPGSTSFADLRREPAILIGAGNNAWTRQIAGQLRFRFFANGSERSMGIVDSQNPTKIWLRGPSPSGGTKDFAIVSRLVDPRVEQVVVIIGGLGPHGTEIAGEFVTNEDQIRKLEAGAPSNWARKNVQLVVSTEVVAGSSGPPKLETSYFW